MDKFETKVFNNLDKIIEFGDGISCAWVIDGSIETYCCECFYDEDCNSCVNKGISFVEFSDGTSITGKKLVDWINS
jgi:hypothetical protein